MTQNEIENVDKELLAERYEAALMNFYEELANGFFEMPFEELIAKVREAGRIQIQGSNWFLLRTNEIVIEYDHEMELLTRIRREGSNALTASYANFLREHSSEIAALDLEETIVAMVKYRASSQDLVDGVWVDVWP
jgi:hypothetical protein